MRLGNCGDICDGSYTYPMDEPGYSSGTAPAAEYSFIGSAGNQNYPSGESPVIISPQQLPAPTTMTMPGMVATAQLTSPGVNTSGLTPLDLIRPLPSIVDNQPTQLANCNSFSEWVDQNPLLAAGILLGLAWMTFRR